MTATLTDVPAEIRALDTKALSLQVNRLGRPCQRPGIDPDLFFPIGTGDAYEEKAEEAKQYCTFCPVKVECLELALQMGPIAQDGIAGGTTVEERRAIIQARWDTEFEATEDDDAEVAA